MKKNLFFSLFAMLLVVSCSDQQLQPNQNDGSTPDDIVAKAKKSKSSDFTTARAPLGKMALTGSEPAECVMSATSNSKNISEYKISAMSGKPGVKKTTRNQGSGTANITVFYLGFTPEAQEAFQAAVDIWASTLDSDVDIFVLAQFAPLPPGVLGSAGSTQIIRDAPGLRRNTWYGNALADKLAGQDLIPNVFDITASFSSVFPNWYFGTDGNTPAGDFDFRTVVLHELGHGLNFFGGMAYNQANGVGSYGFGLDPAFPSIYDQFADTRPGRQLVKTNKFPNPSIKLGNALIGDQIQFSGSSTKSTTRGERAILYTPDNWQPGSSYSHLDEAIYSSTVDGLMTPALAPGESFPNPGPIVYAMFDDMGWNGKIKKPVK